MSGFLNVILGGTSVFSAQANREYLVGYRSGKGTGVTAQSTSILTTNGVPPFTYLWEYMSGNAEIYPYSMIDNTTFFAAYLPNSSSYFTAVWRCKVTDNIGNITYSPNINITLYRTS